MTLATANPMALPADVRAAFARSHDFALDANTLVAALIVGSHSHGTHIPPENDSGIDDTDYMLVVMPPPDHLLGLKSFEHWTCFEGPHDVVAYSFHKFVRLLLKSNPNVMGTLWLRDEFVLSRSEAWGELVRMRRMFASRAAFNSFAGYANGQLHRMTAFDTQAQADWDRVQELRARTGWPLEAILRDEHTEMSLDPSVTKEEMEWLRVNAKRIHARHFQGYMGEKRKGLVRRHGYDVKNAAHLVRLLRMCAEFMETGEMNVFRSDADELIAIKRGAWTLERVQSEAEALFDRARVARDASRLPLEPDFELVNGLVYNLTRWYAL